MSGIGVVAIGRNEGERLRRCLLSVPRSVRGTVYVDSGSTDGSPEVARALGAEVVELDLSTPFTAARARNAGIRHLLADGACDIAFVQILDGDCELAPGFVEAALQVMGEHPRTAVVCGRRRERNRSASIYNTLCDMEWDTPLGEIESCGGDALIRVAAFGEVNGFDERLIAGEEPELCLRMRRQGWSVRRIDRDMTLHDAALVAFRPWWRRTVRAGHAYAELFAKHGHWRREVGSVLLYALVVPLLGLGLGWATSGVSVVLLTAYARLYHRVRRQRLARGDAPTDAALYARFCIVAKFAHLAGMGRYLGNRLLGAHSEIIEYKGPPDAAASSAAKPVAS
jgi:GT2 family glycosyltransferase